MLGSACSARGCEPAFPRYNLLACDIDGKRVWTRIMQPIEELQRERPTDGEEAH